MIRKYYLLIFSFLIMIIVACSNVHKVNELINPAEFIKISPTSLIFDGDIATKLNATNQSIMEILQKMPESSIIVGVNGQSNNPEKWSGGTATLNIELMDTFKPTLYLLKVKAPFKGGKGVYSSKRNSQCKIMLDSSVLWSIGTNFLNEKDKLYYALENDTIFTTFVVSRLGKHTISFEAGKSTAWEIGSIELIGMPYPANLKGIGYSPYRDCQTPGSEWPTSTPTVKQIQEDVFQLSNTCNAIRTYGSRGINIEILKSAKNAGLKVFAGAWIDGDTFKDSLEIEGLLKIAQEVNLDAVIIGNEFLLRQKTDKKKIASQYLLKWINKVKTELNYIPISTAEIHSEMFNIENNTIVEVYKPIIDELDFLLVHIYPFWDKQKIEGSALYTINKFLEFDDILKNSYPNKNKKLIIGETGWPSSGLPRGEAIPSSKNQLIYMTEFLKLAEINNVGFFYFDAYDELWKIEEDGAIGQRWGYCYSDRSSKYCFNSMLLPNTVINSLNLNTINSKCVNSFKKIISVNYFPVQTEWPIDMYYHYSISSNGYAYGEKSEVRYFFPSGFMGDTESINLNCCDKTNVFNGDMSLKAKINLMGNAGWAGIYWLPNAKWDGPGINIYEQLKVKEKSIKIVFWAHGEIGGEKVQFKVGGVNNGDDSVEFPKSSGWITLTNKWEKHEIDLSCLNLSNVVGGFSFITDIQHNPNKENITFFLDNIYYTNKD